MISVCIGSSSNGEDAESEAVLEYTLRKNSSVPLDIVWMRQSNDPISYWSGFNTQLWPTPFSGFRWAIPEYFNFKGRAIYMDEDMVNFRDINDLFTIDLNGKPFAARRGTRFGGHEFCVMVIDCEKARNFLVPVNRQRSLENYHLRCISSFSGNNMLVQDLDPRWNVLDGENLKIEEMYHLHWTKMATQPWRPSWFTGIQEDHPRKDLLEFWEKIKLEAAENGYTKSNYIPNTPPVQYNIIGR